MVVARGHGEDPKAPPSYSERIALLAELYRRAREVHGLDSSSAIIRGIEHLYKYWSPNILKQVSLGLERLDASRIACGGLCDRVPAPDTFPASGLRLGSTPRPCGAPSPVFLDPGRLIYHLLCVGLSGSGKTHLVSKLLELLALQCPHVRVLVVDPNGSCRRMCSAMKGLYMTIRWQDLRLNPLAAVKGISYREWIPRAIDLLGGSELLHSRYLLVKRCEELLVRAGVPEICDGVTPVPNLFDLRKDLETRRERPGSKEAMYLASGLTVIDGRLRSTGEMFRCGRGMESRLIDSRVVLDISGLAPFETMKYIIIHLVNYLYSSRSLAPLIDPPRLSNFVVLEEAGALMMHRADTLRIPFWRELLTRSRACGIGYSPISHDVCNIDNIILSVI